MPAIYRVFHLEFDIENEEFVHSKRTAIARILRKVANKIESEDVERSNKIMDVNGNSIGTFGIIRKGV
jgi:hypothetical protein